MGTNLICWRLALRLWHQIWAMVPLPQHDQDGQEDQDGQNGQDDQDGQYGQDGQDGQDGQSYLPFSSTGAAWWVLLIW